MTKQPLLLTVLGIIALLLAIPLAAFNSFAFQSVIRLWIGYALVTAGVILLLPHARSLLPVITKRLWLVLSTRTLLELGIELGALLLLSMVMQFFQQSLKSLSTTLPDSNTLLAEGGSTLIRNYLFTFGGLVLGCGLVFLGIWCAANYAIYLSITGRTGTVKQGLRFIGGLVLWMLTIGLFTLLLAFGLRPEVAVVLLPLVIVWAWIATTFYQITLLEHSMGAAWKAGLGMSWSSVPQLSASHLVLLGVVLLWTSVLQPFIASNNPLTGILLYSLLIFGPIFVLGRRWISTAFHAIEK